MRVPITISKTGSKDSIFFPSSLNSFWRIRATGFSYVIHSITAGIIISTPNERVRADKAPKIPASHHLCLRIARKVAAMSRKNRLSVISEPKKNANGEIERNITLFLAISLL